MLQNHWLEIADDGLTRRCTPLFKTQSNVAKPQTWNRRRRRNSTAHTSIKNTIECCKTTDLKSHIQNESITFDFRANNNSTTNLYNILITWWKKLPYCSKLKQLIKNWNHFLIDWGYNTSYLKTAHWSLTSFQTECVNTNSNLRFQVIFHLARRA